MSFLGDEILRALILSYRKARNAGAGSGDGIELVPIVEHVAEIQGVRRGEVMVKANSELVVVLSDDLRRGEEIQAAVWEGEKA